MHEYRFIKAIVGVVVAAVTLLSAYSLYFLAPSYTRLITEKTEQEAIRVASHLAGMFIKGELIIEGASGEPQPVSGDILPPDLDGEMNRAEKEFGLMKIKVFSPAGKVVYSTDSTEIGQVNSYSYFRDKVAAGEVYTTVVQKNRPSLEGKVVFADVVETYVPIMDESRFLGAFEIYFDITDTKEKLDRLVSRSHQMLFLIALLLFGVVLYISRRARTSFIEQDRAEKRIIRQSRELLDKNSELSVLYDVSRVISSTIDMQKLLPEILHTVVNRLDILKVEKKGGIFLVEGERMELVCHLGHPAEFLDLHKDMTVDQCLCGLAARTGELIISANSHTDRRHTICYEGMTPHGHIIVPLKTAQKLIGVLYLYIPSEVEIDEHKQGLLMGIGNQIGIAIENARLYAEARELSLRDPLTGIANRRFMEICLDRSIAMVRRYRNPLSVIMLDIDHFKRYNDTYGHAAGDELLVRIAGLMSGQIRESDKASRYGGEEFLLILPETGLQAAHTVADRIRMLVQQQTGVTVSCGIASYRHEMERDELINLADSALYRAKEHGRNRVEIADS